MRCVKLSEIERKELTRLLRTSKNSVILKRCNALLLSDREINSMQEIAEEVGFCRTTLYHLFNRWELSTNRIDRFKALRIGEGRGAKPKLDSIKNELPEIFKKCNGKVYKILQMLEIKYGITVCRATLRKYLNNL